MAIDWKKKKCSPKEFMSAVTDPEVKSYEDLAIRLGYTTKKNVNKSNFKLMAEDLGVDIDKYISDKRKVTPKSNFKRKLENKEIFAKNSPVSTRIVKYRIMSDSLLEYACTHCGITEWCGHKISLHLDHVNGDNKDNRLENLQFLCYNCHSQTETYGNKSTRSNKRVCKNSDCNNTLNKRNKSGICSTCLYSKTYKNIIVDEEVWRKLNMNKKQFTDEWNSSTTIKEAVDKIHSHGNRAKREYIKSVAFSLGLPRDHMNQYSVSSGKRTKEEVLRCLCKDTIIYDNTKKSLIDYGILENKCQYCGIGTRHNDKPLVLQLDHINGDRTDNRLENLRMLCPNCHSLTDTYSRSGIGKGTFGDAVKIGKISGRVKPIKSKVTSSRNSGGITKKYPCTENGCTNQTTKVNGRCLSCYKKDHSKNIPSKQDLIQCLFDNKFNFTKTGCHFNVTDNSVRKWCKKYDLPTYKRDLIKYIEDNLSIDMEEH